MADQKPRRSVLESAREPGLGPTLEHHVADAMALAEFTFLGTVAVLVDRIDVRLELGNLRLGVQPAHAGRNERLPDVADGADHVPPLRLAAEGVPEALQEPEVLIVAERDVEIAQGGHFLEEPHVPRMKHIVTARDDDLGSARERGRRRFRESGQVPRGEHVKGESVRGAPSFLSQGGMRFVHHPEIGPDGLQRGQPIGRHRPGGRMHGRHIPHRLEDVPPLRQRKLRHPAGEGAHRLIGPEQDV